MTELTKAKQSAATEITPEMIEAGAAELLLFEKGADDARLAARMIFEAMVEARTLAEKT